MLVNNFSAYYKRKFGVPVGKITLDRHVPCPNRENGGCIFCAPASFRPYYLERGVPLASQVANGKEFLKKRDFKYYFAYFQQETTTASPVDALLTDFSQALADPACIGLIVSTRPDYVEEELLVRLDHQALQHWHDKEIIMELGLQSAHDHTLKLINRNHTVQDFVRAAAMIRQKKRLQLGAHIILGLPGEGLTEMRHTIGKIADLQVQHLKIHHLQVIKGTELEVRHRQNPLALFETAVSYMRLLAELLPDIPPRVVLHRLWSLSDARILVAPRWGLNNHQLSRLFREILQQENSYQGKNLHLN